MNLLCRCATWWRPTPFTLPRWMQPFQGCPYSATTSPQGSRGARQPWAERFNPLGIEWAGLSNAVATAKHSPIPTRLQYVTIPMTSGLFFVVLTECHRSWNSNSLNPHDIAVTLSIPKGLQHPAQGCESSSYPGVIGRHTHVNPERVASALHASVQGMIYGSVGFAHPERMPFWHDSRSVQTCSNAS